MAGSGSRQAAGAREAVLIEVMLEGPVEPLADRVIVMDAESVDGGDGEEIAGGTRDEETVGTLKVGELERSFAHGDAWNGDFLKQEGARDAGQATGGQGGSEHFAAEDGEEIGRSEFGDLVAFVEQDDFVESLFLSPFVHAEIEGPGKHLGAGEFTGGMAGLSNETEAHA